MRYTMNGYFWGQEHVSMQMWNTISQFAMRNNATLRQKSYQPYSVPGMFWGSYRMLRIDYEVEGPNWVCDKIAEWLKSNAT